VKNLLFFSGECVSIIDLLTFEGDTLNCFRKSATFFFASSFAVISASRVFFTGEILCFFPLPRLLT